MSSVKIKKKDDGNNKIFYLIAIVIVLVVLFSVLKGLLNKEPEVKPDENKIEEIQTDNYLITYYYAKSFGKKSDTTPRTIKMDQDGHIVISLSEEDIGVEALEYDIEKDKVKNVVDFLNERKIFSLDSNLSTECMDGTTEYFIVKINEDSTKVGGHCVSNQNFRDSVSYFLDVIDKNKLDRFNKTVDLMYSYE